MRRQDGSAFFAVLRATRAEDDDGEPVCLVVAMELEHNEPGRAGFGDDKPGI